MILLFSCILFSIGLFAWKYFHFGLNPITVICFVWSVVLPLSTSESYGVYVPSDKTYLIIIIGLLSFLLGGILGSTKAKFVLGPKNLNNDCNTLNYRLNYRFINILCIISLAYYLFQFAIVIKLLASGMSYDTIRDIAVGDGVNLLNSSVLISQLKGLVAYPTTYLMIALLPVEIFFGKKNKIVIIEALGLMALFVLTSGGRSVIIWFAIYLAVVYIFYKKQDLEFKFKLDNKYKVAIIVGFILLYLFMLYITKSRKGDDVDLLKELYIYFVVPVTHFSHYIDVVDASGVYGMGVSSFYGFLYPLFFLLRMTHIFNGYPDFILNIHYMSFEMMEKGYSVGGGINMNAFVTMFYQPYLDGRFLGVVIIMILFGFISSRVFINAYYRKNIKALTIYLLLMQKLVFSLVRFYFTQSTQAICLIFAFFAVQVVYDYGIEGSNLNE